MSAFCIFGLTLDMATDSAELSVPKFDKKGAQITPEVRHQMVGEAAAHKFTNFIGPKQISPAFDAPQFALDWLKVAEGEYGDWTTKLMFRGIDESGNKISWRPFHYSGGATSTGGGDKACSSTLAR
jgi:hypothetical protein